MDIDISDILADVSRLPPTSSTPTTTTTSSSSRYNAFQSVRQDLDTQSSYTDHQLLTRAWTSERCAPDLLPYPTDLVVRITERIANQIAKIEDLTGDAYSNVTARLVNGRGGMGNVNLNLTLSILQTDLSRTQFLLRSFLRQRMAKITRHAVYYLKRLGKEQDTKAATSSSLASSNTAAATTGSNQNPNSIHIILSQTEKQFLQHHQSLLTDLYSSSFLSTFPPNLRRLDDSSGGVNMVESPERRGAVFVRCLRDEWGNEEEFLSGGRLDDEVGGDEGESVTTELRFRRGEIWVVRWCDVKTGVVRGDLELL